MSPAGEFQAVTFGLGQEVFAVPVTLVREILDYQEPFHVPNGPAYMLGLTDVRGRGVPTIDFRLRLGLPAVPVTSATRIVILDVPLPDRTLALGLLVDRVLSVSAFDRSAIEPAPDIGVRWQSAYIDGVVRQESGFVVIVDVARIFSSEESALLTHEFGQVA